MRLYNRRHRRRGKELTWREFWSHKLVPAFAELKRSGVYARTDDWECCANCTHAKLSEMAGPDTFLSYVAFHEQSIPQSGSGGWSAKSKSEWDAPFSGIYLQHGLHSADDGEMVVKSFTDRGLVVEWDRSNGTAIAVRSTHSPARMWRLLREHVQKRRVGWYWHGLVVSSACDEGGTMRREDWVAYEADSPLQALVGACERV